MYSSTGMSNKLSSSTSTKPCFRFSLAVIQSATRDFDKNLVIGEGGFGKVYKGCICVEEASHVVAIKRRDPMSSQSEPEFRAEIEMLSKLRHCHLVSLIGFCDDNKEMILVYEYMPHGTLHDHLHTANTPLSWMQRLKIAIGAARGLDYLHTGVGTHYGVIHRDVKSSNILLDENWAAMVADFGLSKIGPTNQSVSYIDASIKGTFGYLDPEYFYTRQLTRKTDVFAFGVVLFELLSGRLPVSIRYGEEHCSLVRWAQKCVKERKLDQMVDSSITGTIAPKCLRRFARTAYHCLHNVPKERPTMTEVVASLQGLLELQKKYDLSPESPSRIGFPWKIQKNLVSATKLQNFDNISTSSQQRLESIMIQHEELKMFTYCELKCATRDFGNDRFLGEGSYGKVYKGWVDKKTYFPHRHSAGLPVAVKQIRHNNFCDLEMLKEFSHPNLVKLIGYCLEDEKLVLVYELALNRNFKDCLSSGGVARLPLATKVKMAIGIARGIAFLQQKQLDKVLDEVDQRFWPGPVNLPWLERHKILLDKDFTAKLSGYDINMLVDGHYPSYDNRPDIGDYYPGFYPFEQQSNLSGFEVIFAEVLTGEQISNPNELWTIERLFIESGKESLDVIAKLCYEKCNEVNSESYMLTILKEYDELIQKRLKSWLLDPPKGPNNPLGRWFPRANIETEYIL